MNVYELRWTFYVAAESRDEAVNTINLAIGPFSPEFVTNDDDPAIESSYIDEVRVTNYTPDDRAKARLIAKR